MPDKIKTRNVVKGTIKSIDKSAVAAERMKEVFVKTKEKAEQDKSNDISPNEYAVDNVTHDIETAGNKISSQIYQQGQKNFNITKNNLSKAKQIIKDRRVTHQPKEKKPVSVNQDSHGLTNSFKQNEPDKFISPYNKKIRQKPERATIKTTAKTGKGTIKEVKRTVKTAENTSKVAVKTTRQTANTAQKTAKASAKAAQKAAQASRTVAKATATSLKAAAATIKAIIAATKALISAIIAGGWVAVVIILIICVIGLIVGSCFGIFFSGESGNNGETISQVVSEVNNEYLAEIEQIKKNTAHDDYEINGITADWKEVLAVYSVKTNTDSANPQEVATIDNSKKEIIKKIFWDMNKITYRTERKTETIIETSDDGNGNVVEQEKTVTQTYLYISIQGKSATEMTEIYGFSIDQKKQLDELLDEQFETIWAQLIGGYSIGTGEIIITDSDHIPIGIFSWPLPESFHISSPFGYRADPFTGKTKFHGGLDIAAPAGTPILAASDGTVIIANATDTWGGGYGYHVKLNHDNTEYYTLYGHCSSICVVNGQKIKKGQVIAYVGTTGNSTGNHLHFEVYKNGERVNPLNYFK